MFALTPAAAQTSDEARFSSLTLTLYTVKGTPSEHGSRLEKIADGTLRCRPAGGDHHRPRAACNDMRKVNGFIDLIGDVQQPCTGEYAPVYAVAEGYWQGDARLFGKVYPNRCEAVRSTGGSLFDI